MPQHQEQHRSSGGRLLNDEGKPIQATVVVENLRDRKPGGAQLMDFVDASGADPGERAGSCKRALCHGRSAMYRDFHMQFSHVPCPELSQMCMLCPRILCLIPMLFPDKLCDTP